MKESIDVRKLKSDAAKSCCKESYVVLERNSILRIGAGARASEGDDGLLFIEISLKLCPGKSITNTVTLEKSVQLAKQLKEMGYEIACDEGQITFEKAVSGSEMNREYQRALRIIIEMGIFIPAPAGDSALA